MVMLGYDERMFQIFMKIKHTMVNWNKDEKSNSSMSLKTRMLSAYDKIMDDLTYIPYGDKRYVKRNIGNAMGNLRKFSILMKELEAMRCIGENFLKIVMVSLEKLRKDLDDHYRNH